ncbi:MAG: hypothetical protein K2K25_09160, partial [Muribaculaceae bacterium]|nr:hypothetical protein [Muribaculaceae bacterium]
ILDIYEEFTAKLDAFNDGDWAQLLDEYQQKLADAKVATEQAKLEAAAVKVDQKEVYDAPDEIQKQIDELKNEEIAIAPFTIDPIDQLSAINSDWGSPQILVSENPNIWPGNKYQVTDPISKPWLVEAYLDENYSFSFNYWIKQFTMAQFDENDKAWTLASLAELKRRAENEEPYKTAKANWELAKKVYNNGEPADGSVLPLGGKIVSEVEAYNAYEGKLKDAKDAKEVADEAVKETNKIWQEKLDAYNGGELPGNLTAYLDAKEAFDEAVKKAESIKAQAVGGYDPIAEKNVSSTLWAERQNALKQIDNKVTTLRNKVTIADANLAAAEAAAAADPKNTALAEAVTQAKIGVKTAEKDLSDYTSSSWDDDNNYVPSKEEADRTAIREAYDDAVEAANKAYDKAYAEAHNAFLKAEDEFLAAGGTRLPENDPAYEEVAKAEANYKAALKAQQDADDAVQAVKDEVKPLLQPIREDVIKQYEQMGFHSYYEVWNVDQSLCIPEDYMIDNYLNDRPNYINGVENWDFPAASAPAEYKDKATQVYTNAKQFVIRTSRAAYGYMSSYDQNRVDTWDWASDQAFLIDEVTVETLNMYITKMLVNRGLYKEEQINPFIISQYYIGQDPDYPLFGAFGELSGVLYQISCAEICTAPGAENAITAQIDKLVAARDEMVDACQAQMDKLKDLKDQWDAADKAKEALDEEAQAAINSALTIENAYKAIVEEPLNVYGPNGEILGTIKSLKDYVEEIKNAEFKDFYDKEFGNTAEGIKKDLEEKIKTNKDKLITAQELLAKYEYQLGQLESDEYAKVENPYKFQYEYWQAEADKYEAAMNFWEQRYKDLEAQYEAAKKNLNYPD